MKTDIKNVGYIAYYKLNIKVRVSRNYSGTVTLFLLVYNILDTLITS